MKICKECGNEFIPKRTTSKFCSKKCRDKDYNRNYYLEHKEQKRARDKARREKIKAEKEVNNIIKK